jgi:hypothetical protein
MDGPLIVITESLREQRQLIDGSIIRLARSAQIHNQMQQRIVASVARLGRMRASKWSKNVPTLPRWTASLLEPKTAFESMKD